VKIKDGPAAVTGIVSAHATDRKFCWEGAGQEVSGSQKTLLNQ